MGFDFQFYDKSGNLLGDTIATKEEAQQEALEWSAEYNTPVLLVEVVNYEICAPVCESCGDFIKPDLYHCPGCLSWAIEAEQCAA